MPQSVIDLITADHRDVEAIFEKLRTQIENRPALVAELAAKFTAHARAEEAEVYGELAKAKPSEAGEVHHGTEEHHEAEEHLAELMETNPRSDAFAQVLEQMEKAVKHHVEEEETKILPALGKALSRDRLAELAWAFSTEKAKSLSAPPRPTGRTKQELLDMAKEKGVEGAGKMTKEELTQALESAS